MIMNPLVSFLIIAFMTACSKFLRQYGFGRADSIALDIAICSFLFNLIVVIKTFTDPAAFLRHELLRCVLLLVFPLVISVIHHQNKKRCMKKIAGIVAEIKAAGRYEGDDSAANEIGSRGRFTEATILDNLEILANSSIDVWYSQWADAAFRKPLGKYYELTHAKDEKKDDVRAIRKSRSFKEKKKKVRSAFVDIVNSLPTVNGQLTRASYADEDFNIDNRRQIIGIVTFDVMAVLSVILAVRIV